MHFISCRDLNVHGRKKRYTFEEAIIAGWADDGGMLLPETLPTLSAIELDRWKQLSYVDLCIEFLSHFISQDEIPRHELRELVVNGLSVFPNEEKVTMHSIEEHENLHVCELWHGPTLAFKDLGMQVLVQFVNYFLKKRNERLTILVGTSGDTGSSAIEAVQKTSNMDIVVLYPKGRISSIQELQMTSRHQSPRNVYVLAVDGTSDDLDVPIEKIFRDSSFKRKHRVGSLNSVNICRVLVQAVHYFYSYFQVTKHKPNGINVKFYVPTGAGGHVASGVIARRMGLTNIHLAVCTNENDILHQMITKGQFHMRDSVKQTNSPSMDIQVPYNIERLLYLHTGSAEKVYQWMKEFKQHGKLDFSKRDVERLLLDLGISSGVASTNEVSETIKRTYKHCGQYILDPHTAVGVKVAVDDERMGKKGIKICMGCAHPAKFEEILAQVFQTSNDQVVEMLKEYHNHGSVAKVLAMRGGTFHCPVLRRGENWESQLRRLIEDISRLPQLGSHL